MRVIVTRPAEDAEKTAAALAAAGHTAILSPVLSIAPVRDAALPTEGITGLFVTSRHAITALSSHPDAGAFRSLPILCVGAATADAARAAGFETVRSGGGDVKAMIAEMDAADWPGPVLYPSGEIISFDPTDALAAKGISLIRCIVYRAEPVPQVSMAAKAALEDRTCDGVLFLSPRSVNEFLRQAEAAGVAGLLPRLTAWCMSDSIGFAAKRAGFGSISVARDKSEESLIASIAAAQ